MYFLFRLDLSLMQMPEKNLKFEILQPNAAEIVWRPGRWSNQQLTMDAIPWRLELT